MARKDAHSKFGYQQYELHLPLRFRAYRGEVLVASGEGETLSIGAKDVLFRTDHPPVGALVAELSIDWPVLLEGRLPLQLCIFGDIDSCAGEHVLVHISDYELKLKSALAHGAGR
jgi:hypothetical protein